MHMKRYRYISRLLIVTLSLFSSALLGQSPKQEGKTYVWPIASNQLLSSTFGEYREGHFHAGFDIRTFGRTGIPCLAVNEGYVARLKISPQGYGKALYLKLDDGNTAVYAHLSDFNRKCDSVAYYWRLERETSYCDIRIPDSLYRCSPGETICYSGRSGTSAAHLHFELRDQQERPFNPGFVYGVPDKVSPIIMSLEVVPLKDGSLVNGYPVQRDFYFDVAAEDEFILPDTLQMEGQFGFGAVIWDEQGYGRYHLAPFSVELYIDGVRIYRLENDRFAYSQSREVFLEFDNYTGGFERRPTLLFKRRGSTRADRMGSGIVALSNGKNSGRDSVDCLSMGFHSGKIVARDLAGNESVGRFYFFMHRYPRVRTAVALESSNDVIVLSDDADGGKTQNRLYQFIPSDSSMREVFLSPYGRYLRGSASEVGVARLFRLDVTDDEGACVHYYFSGGSSEVAEVDGVMNREIRDDVYCEFTPFVTMNEFGLLIKSDYTIEGIPHVYRAEHGGGDTAEVFMVGPREVYALFPRDSLRNGVNVFEIRGYGWGHVRFESVFALRALLLRSGSKGTLKLGDGGMAVRAPSLVKPLLLVTREVTEPGKAKGSIKRRSPVFSLDFRPEYLRRPLDVICSTDKRVGLFKWDDKKGWKCIGAPFMNQGIVKVEMPGIYAFFEDGVPPMIQRISREKRSAGSGFFRSSVPFCSISDDGAGVDPYATYVKMDGKRVVSEWDGFRNRLYIPVPSSLPGGNHRLIVEAVDKCGNSSVAKFDLLIE